MRCTSKLLKRERSNMTPDEMRKKVSPQVIANKSFNKIFCIGYNKTGTTTLEATLGMYGYNMPSQRDQEIRLSKNVFETNYTEFISFVDKYDAFQDMPFSQGLTFVAADALFPNSKFILSIRDSDDWYRSLINFTRNKYGVDLENIDEKVILEKFNYLYKFYDYENKKRLLTTFEGLEKVVDWTNLFNKEYYIEMYERRNNEIKKYFMNAPEKLLIIDVAREPTTARLCEFLGIPKNFVIKMPHRNRSI